LVIAAESSKKQQICQRIPDPFAKKSWAVGVSAVLASFVGIFVIPPFYVAFQGVREWLTPAARPRLQQVGPTEAQSEGRGARRSGKDVDGLTLKENLP
jgi:hypothetical protein